MGRSQHIFEEMFGDDGFGPRNGFVPRRWQVECLTDYQDSLDARDAVHGTEGPHQHQFTVYAGTGSGKTNELGLVGSMMLNTKRVGQLVVVVPNRSIRLKTQKVLRHFFGIDLAVFNARKHADGIPRMKQGYILTYAHLMQNPTLHRRISASVDTLVIFDEVHHLGDCNGWGESALEAFGLAPYALCLTGTPFRAKGCMAYTRYEDTDIEGIVRFCPDYSYRLGRAIADGVCRTPLFTFYGATVLIRTDPLAGEITATFDDTNVNEGIASLRLRGAVRYGSADRRAMLKDALDLCRKEKRKVIVFLGGDTEGEETPTNDAKVLLPSELEELGIGPGEFDVVTGDDKEALGKIEAFGKSDKWILVSINMVSEGVDIPELSAAIFLTSITAKQTTVQRIGRALRLMGENDPHAAALIFMFRDPNLVAIGDEIKDEILQEKAVRRKRAEADAGNGEMEKRSRAEAIGIGTGERQIVKFNGREWPAEVFEKARQMLARHGLAPTMLNTVMRLMMEGDHGIG
jgi:superfamily II DNA or RNA helicase